VFTACLFTNLLCLAVVDIPPLYHVICTLQLTTLLHLFVVMVIHDAGDDVAGSMNAHIPQRGEGQGEGCHTECG
jgi:hypothetical protein